MLEHCGISDGGDRLDREEIGRRLKVAQQQLASVATTGDSATDELMWDADIAIRRVYAAVMQRK